MDCNKIYAFRIVFIGDSNVGKTTLCNALRGCYTTNYDDDEGFFTSNTVGAEFSSTIETYKEGRQGSVSGRIRLDFWGTAGQERYRSIVPLFFRHADLFLLVFDITNRISFQSLPAWIELIREHDLSKYEKGSVILVANKSDRENAIPVTISKKEIDNMVHSLFEDYFIEQEKCQEPKKENKRRWTT